VYLVATLPEARGRGLATALMSHALLEARERGCTTTSLQSSARGRPVYARLGYREIGVVQMWERRQPV
jgi:GNAT superfamily N-acetyltransferase